LLETAHGSLRAKQVILTGNGFMPEHLHRSVQGRPLPVQSAIVVTRPMSEAELQQKGWHTENPTINSKHMFFYYRLLSDRRFMLGGRANHIGDPAGAEQTFRGLKQSITHMWPQFADVHPSMARTGLLRAEFTAIDRQNARG
jgi:glycine/D-amino acid oxidase-like deaminating enzyme